MAIEAETKVTGFLLKWDSIKTVDMEVEVEKLQKELLGSCYDLFTCVASYCCLAAFPYIGAWADCGGGGRGGCGGAGSGARSADGG